MQIQINGKPVACEGDATVRDVLAQLELKPETVVVERNRELVPGERFGDTRLEEGDILEVLHFVGGG